MSCFISCFPNHLLLLTPKDCLGFCLKMSLPFRFFFSLCWILVDVFVDQIYYPVKMSAPAGILAALATFPENRHPIAMLTECHFQRKFPDLHLFHENEILFHGSSSLLAFEYRMYIFESYASQFFFFSWLIFIIFTYRPLFLAWKCNQLAKRFEVIDFQLYKQQVAYRFLVLIWYMILAAQKSGRGGGSYL